MATDRLCASPQRDPIESRPAIAAPRSTSQKARMPPKIDYNERSKAAADARKALLAKFDLAGLSKL